MNTLDKDFVPCEESQALKGLGFDEPCFGYWNIAPSLPTKYLNPRCEPFKHEWYLSAPTFQQAFRWFREKYNLLVSPFQSLDDKTYQVRDYYFEIVKVGNLNVIVSTDNFQTYDEAELACLRKLIEIVKLKQTKKI